MLQRGFLFCCPGGANFCYSPEATSRQYRVVHWTSMKNPPAVKLLTKAEARRIAANVAKLSR
jgi:hypothetical protein